MYQLKCHQNKYVAPEGETTKKKKKKIKMNAMY